MDTNRLTIDEPSGLAAATERMAAQLKRLRQVEDAIAVCRRRKILLVDDERDYTDSFTALLGTRYQIRCVNDPNEAIDAAIAFLPELILLDCMMPTLPGKALAGRLQRHPELRDIPFAFLTALTTSPMASEHCEYAGAQVYIPKAMPADDLAASLQMLLRSR